MDTLKLTMGNDNLLQRSDMAGWIFAVRFGSKSTAQIPNYFSPFLNVMNYNCLINVGFVELSININALGPVINDADRGFRAIPKGPVQSA